MTAFATNKTKYQVMTCPVAFTSTSYFCANFDSVKKLTVVCASVPPCHVSPNDWSRTATSISPRIPSIVSYICTYLNLIHHIKVYIRVKQWVKSNETYWEPSWELLAILSVVAFDEKWSQGQHNESNRIICCNDVFIHYLQHQRFIHEFVIVFHLQASFVIPVRFPASSNHRGSTLSWSFKWIRWTEERKSKMPTWQAYLLPSYRSVSPHRRLWARCFGP